MNPRNFFAELKRRNVYKVAVAYAVVAWLLIQVATQVFPFFEIPNWAVRLVVLLLILGFPVALVLAWAFELTPEGIARVDEVPPSASITRKTGRKLIGITLVVAMLAAGLLVVRLMRPTKVTMANVPLAVAEKSIAVLPFDNLSEDKANAFFASGIQDEILTRLAKIGALKVISRTSSQQYQSKPSNLSDIAKQLGVANILEGSVQKVGNAVHINVQLIQAATDAHLWAESYDRELQNIFGVEGEVAGAIAEALNAKLTGAEVKAVTARPTTNVAAYEAYLRAVATQASHWDYPASQEAAEDYAEAVRLDPKFALAWARMATVRSYLYFNGVDLARNSPTIIKDAADRARALQPDLGEGWIAQGYYRYRVLRDFNGALKAFAKAGEKMLGNGDLFLARALIERRLGRFDAAERPYAKALEKSPRDINILDSFASECLAPQRRFREAQAVFDRAIGISPGDIATLANKASAYHAEGRLVEAAGQLAQIPADCEDDSVRLTQAQQFIYERKFAEAVTALQRDTTAPKSGEPLSSGRKCLLPLLGYSQQWSGRAADAHATFERAVVEIKPTATAAVLIDATQLPAFLALAYAGLGDKEQALRQAQQAIADYADDAASRPTAEIVLAQIQARFGETDPAIASLPHLLEVPYGVTRRLLRIDPLWDPLRNDPRFQKLVEERGAATATP